MFSPIGIMSLIAGEVVKMDDFGAELERIGFYLLIVVSGLLLHTCVSLPLLVLFVGRRNPITYVYGILQAVLTAFGTVSSYAAMPVSLECLEKNNNIDHRVSRLIIPLGATINMDGTALYEAFTAVYAAQAIGEPLNFGTIILIGIMAAIGSVSAAGVPQAGLVSMIMVLLAVGLDPSYASVIFSVDWILERLRTAANVYGDCMGGAIVQSLCRQQLTSAVEEQMRF